MCGLCGILGGKGHWTDSSANPDTFIERAESHTIRRERLDRTALVDRVLKYYGLGLKDWAGSSYMLRGSTGKTALVDNLSQMWAEAQVMSNSDFDPLDEDLITYLQGQRAP
jgi:hypothetical protein